MCATDNLALPIVKHCRTLSFKNYVLICRSNNKGFYFFMNDNSDND